MNVIVIESMPIIDMYNNSVCFEFDELNESQNLIETALKQGKFVLLTSNGDY